MKKRTIILVITVALLLVFAGTVTGISLAIWKEVKSKDIGIGIEPELNPSLRYQIFAPLDSSGNLIEFEAYSQAKHGNLQYSYVTDKGYTLYFQSDGVYETATQYAIRTQTLFVRNGISPYSEAIHGERQYRVSDKNGSPVYYLDNDEVYIPYNEILFSNNGNNLYVRDSSSEKENYIKIELSDLVALDKTINGYSLLYFDIDSYVPATSENIINGTDLFVYDYTEYVKSSEDSENQFGNIVIDSKTSKGYSLYKKLENDYITYYPTSLTDSENTFAGDEIISYALVGYTGIVAELKIPPIYTDENGTEFSVTRICSSNDYAEESFANNPIITSIIIPATIDSIADATFENLSNLKTIYFTGTGTVRLGDYCFLACVKLETVYMGDGETSSVKLVDSSGRNVELNENDIVFKGCTSLN